MRWNDSASLVLAGALMGVASVLAFTPTPVLTRAAEAAVASVSQELNLFGDVFERVRADYVEKPDDAALIQSAINGMVSGLDAESSYLSPKDLKAVGTTAGSTSGDLGLVLTVESGAIKVVSAIDDTPAAKAGILANDFITAIDGVDLPGVTLGQAIDQMRGAVGAPITLTVVRSGVDKPYDVKLQRAETTVQSVRSREDGQVGYIRISQFTRQTDAELRAAIGKIQSDLGMDKVQGYVIDLRSNPGGVFDQAVAVADDFLDGGAVVSMRGRDPAKARRIDSHPGDLAPGKPIVLLVNGGSASEAEIVAGALQDDRRATILGTRSFGRGSMQSIIPLGTNGALRLTTARYYTPSGRSIQAKGIDPDIIVAEDLPPGVVKTSSAPTGQTTPQGSGSNVATNAKVETGSPGYVSPDPQDDKQLVYALNLLRGVVVNATFPPDPSQGVPN
jgi:carboxyl-terminal processing protease